MCEYFLEKNRYSISLDGEDNLPEGKHLFKNAHQFLSLLLDLPIFGDGFKKLDSKVDKEHLIRPRVV